jgi:ATP-dependent RNA helicase DOB1
MIAVATGGGVADASSSGNTAAPAVPVYQRTPLPEVIVLDDGLQERADGKACRHDVALAPGMTREQFEAARVAARPEQHAPPAKEYPFTLDPFQKEAVQALEDGHSVLVSAHTSAGKTVVAEYACAMALRDGQRVIYTSPIKALSNQKYRDLKEEFDDVGILTGDTTINPNASCLVMTTEILRSMIYRGSEVVREVAFVVFDEVHYMRDAERGVVWEESIVLVPHSVRFVFLSATIPNASEFAQWVAKVHGQPCHVVYTNYRPTPLQHYMFPAGGEGVFLVVDEKGKFKDGSFAKAMNVLAPAVSKEEMAMGLHGGQRKGGKKAKKSKRGGDPVDLLKIVEMIMSRNYSPVIVFSFSKRQCESYAAAVVRKGLDFNTQEEKNSISEVFNAAVANLAEEDRKLPQIQAILPLLKKGVGIHHGGLIPLIKEVVEILFQERLLKCLFTTETFAMGINMPSKTVVFTAARKFDGKEFRWVSAGEYIQMSGRAGRRGIDDRGIVIQMMDEKIEPAAAKEMLRGQADPLVSSFHLGYNMLINMMRLEDVDIEFLVRHSLKQHQAEVSRPLLEARLADAEEARDAVDIGCPSDSMDAVAQYWRLIQQASQKTEEVHTWMNRPKYALPFLQSGRLVRVRELLIGADGDEDSEAGPESGVDGDWGWGVIVSFQRRPSRNAAQNKSGRSSSSSSSAAATASASAASPSSGDFAASDYTVDVLLPCRTKIGARSRQAAGNGDLDSYTPCALDPKAGGQMQVFPVRLENIVQFSALRIYVPKDLKSKGSREAARATLREVHRRFPKQIPSLDPVKDMQIIDEEFKALHLRVTNIQQQLEQSSIHSHADRSAWIEAYSAKMVLAQQAAALRKEIRATEGLRDMRDKIKRMKRVLRRLGFTDKNNVVQMKGQVACEVNSGAQELLVVELIFNNVFSDLSVPQITALLSCLVFTDGGDKFEGKLPKELDGPFQQLRAIAQNVGEIMQEAGVLDGAESDGVTEFVDTFRPDIMEVVYEWTKGKKFVEVCKINEKLFEGTIIRAMRRLEEFMKQMCLAAKVIGDNALEDKFKEAIVALKRVRHTLWFRFCFAGFARTRVHTPFTFFSLLATLYLTIISLFLYLLIKSRPFNRI